MALSHRRELASFVPNVKAHPTVPGASVVCGNLDGMPKRVKLDAGHRSACSVLLGILVFVLFLEEYDDSV